MSGKSALEIRPLLQTRRSFALKNRLPQYAWCRNRERSVAPFAFDTQKQPQMQLAAVLRSDPVVAGPCS